MKTKMRTKKFIELWRNAYGDKNNILEILDLYRRYTNTLALGEING